MAGPAASGWGGQGQGGRMKDKQTLGSQFNTANPVSFTLLKGETSQRWGEQSFTWEGGGASSVSMESNVSASLDTMQQLTIRLLQDNENMKRLHTQTPNDLLRTAGIIVTQTSVSADISWCQYDILTQQMMPQRKTKAEN